MPKTDKPLVSEEEINICTDVFNHIFEGTVRSRDIVEQVLVAAARVRQQQQEEK